MSAERRPAVVVSRSQQHLRLRYSAQCSSCGGCGGRCSVFAEDGEQAVELIDTDPSLSPGDAVELVLPGPQLLRQAALGYGLPLLGLLVGAAAGSALGDAATAVGAVLGTSLAVAYSKRAARRLPMPQIRPTAS